MVEENLENLSRGQIIDRIQGLINRGALRIPDRYEDLARIEDQQRQYAMYFKELMKRPLKLEPSIRLTKITRYQGLDYDIKSYQASAYFYGKGARIEWDKEGRPIRLWTTSEDPILRQPVRSYYDISLADEEESKPKENLESRPKLVLDPNTQGLPQTQTINDLMKPYTCSRCGLTLPYGNFLRNNACPNCGTLLSQMNTSMKVKSNNQSSIGTARSKP